MTLQTAQTPVRKPPAYARSRAAQQPWTRETLARAFTELHRDLLRTPAPMAAEGLISNLVDYAMQPRRLDAINKRRDRTTVAEDLAAGYAFAQIASGASQHQLHPLLRQVVDRTSRLVYEREAYWAGVFGESPFDEDPKALTQLLNNLAGFVPTWSLRYWIDQKLRKYTSPVSRCMQQIEYLVTRPAVCDAFVEFVLDAQLPRDLRERLEDVAGEEGEALFKARLALMARGGGRKGLDPVTTVRFFGLRKTIAFVERFAGTLETARSLYVEEQFAKLPWQGRSRIPDNRAYGYVEAALMQLDRQQRAIGRLPEFEDEDDEQDNPLLRAFADPRPDESFVAALRSRTFERWVIETALDRAPHDPFWCTADAIFLRGLTDEEVVAMGLADEARIAAVRMQMDTLRADRALWDAWASSLA